MTTIGNISWGSGPTIPITIKYDYRRSGADMQYKISVSVGSVSGASYFGYPIYLSLTLGGSARLKGYTLKASSPSQWSSAITYTSGWLTVSKKTTGTTPLSVRIYSGSGSTRDNTYAYNLSISPAASTFTTASSTTLGKKQTLDVKLYGNFTHTLTYTCGNLKNQTAGTEFIWNANTGTLTASFTPPVALAAQNTTGTSVTIQLTLTTKDTSTLAVVGTCTRTITATIPASCKPALSITLTDPMDNDFTQNQSSVRIELNETLSYNSAIKSRKVTVFGKTYSLTSNALSITKLPDAGTFPISVTITDARGRSTTATASLTVAAYSPPTVTEFAAARCDAYGTPQDDGEYMLITFIGTAATEDTGGVATYTIQYRDRETEDAEWIDAESSISGTILPADTEKAYDVRIKVMDKYSTIFSPTLIVAVAYVLVQWDAKNRSLGIGQRAVEPNTVAITMPTIKFNGNRFMGITEVGTANGWSYRKWTDGTLECWKAFSAASVAVSNAWGALYTASMDIPLSEREYPYAFTTPPDVSITGRANGSGSSNFWIATCCEDDADSGNEAFSFLTHAPATQLIRPTSASAKNPTVHYYVHGKCS